MRLWLIGMMGSGKTTAGKLAASRLEVPFHDTDEFVAERMGCSIAQMWGTLGEYTFRDMEKVAMAHFADRVGVIATGGGVVLDEENRRVMSDGMSVVWLEASSEALLARLEPTVDRPGLVSADVSREDFLTEMLEHRRPLYADVASHQVDTESMTVDVVAAKIEKIWRS